MSNENCPEHIGIIMDGNRRWAVKQGLEPWKGHEVGEQKFEEMLEWCKEYDVKELTLYTFSMQNFKRTKVEIDLLMRLLKKGAQKILDDKEFNSKHNVNIRFVGRLGLFNQDIQDLMKAVMEKTKDCDGYVLNLAMGYGGREEIIDATRKIAEKVVAGKLSINDINEKMFGDYLYLNSDPELIIRTSGEKRTSNFLIWQSVYSEWIFVEKFWPDFTKEDFKACLDNYSNRERRLGK